jgi:hypothetical protein
MNIPIKNINDLREEIFRLKAVERDQSVALAQRFKSPSAVFSTLMSLFPKSEHSGETEKGFFDQDIVGLLSRIILPFTLNKTLFRKSNFIVKTLVGLVSQKASHFITEDSVVSIWDKVKSWLPGKGKHEDPAHKGKHAIVKSAVL